ncbi:hypothetical protein BT67DRAFT_61291 [Trichocladium antarcticum]|uniref:Uncharacterized protein n=1 Tax=Trichocladium antarcticum TaxID=1450529 RepID=A0AAN6UKA9_9PEZI|nr:hypothetical protein BT67DRAFT_61291 [Trichocladium antarcticum]
MPHCLTLLPSHELAGDSHSQRLFSIISRSISHRGQDTRRESVVSSLFPLSTNPQERSSSKKPKGRESCSSPPIHTITSQRTTRETCLPTTISTLLPPSPNQTPPSIKATHHPITHHPHTHHLHRPAHQHPPQPRQILLHPLPLAELEPARHVVRAVQPEPLPRRRQEPCQRRLELGRAGADPVPHVRAVERQLHVKGPVREGVERLGHHLAVAVATAAAAGVGVGAGGGVGVGGGGGFAGAGGGFALALGLGLLGGWQRGVGGWRLGAGGVEGDGGREVLRGGRDVSVALRRGGMAVLLGGAIAILLSGGIAILLSGRIAILLSGGIAILLSGRIAIRLGSFILQEGVARRKGRSHVRVPGRRREATNTWPKHLHTSSPCLAWQRHAKCRREDPAAVPFRRQTRAPPSPGGLPGGPCTPHWRTPVARHPGSPHRRQQCGPWCSV